MNRGHGMMKRLIAVLVLAFATAIPLMADTWTDPDTGYTWMYRINGETVEIVNPSYYAAISPSPNGNVAVPNTLGGMPVTCIGDSAFYNCSDLTSVTIPNSITNIGPYAFESCSSLMSVTIPQCVSANYNGLSSVFQGGGGVAVAARAGRAPYRNGRDARFQCGALGERALPGWSPRWRLSIRPRQARPQRARRPLSQCGGNFGILTA